jgi:predicted dehydrogenase
MLPEVEVVGACEINAERRQRMGKQFDIRAVYDDSVTLLEKEKPDIVIIGTPPDSHRDLCLLALDHGAHVFCEKPFVKDANEATQTIESAERNGLAVTVNNQYRYMEMYRVTKERIDQGDFGRLFLLQCWQQMMHPPSKERGWRAELIRSTLFEFGTHTLDLICFFFNGYPVSVNAHIPHPRPDIAADVVVQATLRFPNEGLATMTLNRISHAPERYLEMRLDCERASVRLSLGGVARASVDWAKALGRPIFRCSLVKGGEARAEAGGRSRVIATERHRAYTSATAANLRRFISEIESGVPSARDAYHARELIRIVSAGYESADTGETVWLQR